MQFKQIDGNGMQADCVAKVNYPNPDVGQTSLALKTLVKKVRRHDEKSEYGPQVRNRSPERQLLHQLLFFTALPQIWNF